MMWLLTALLLCGGVGLYLWADRQICDIREDLICLTDSLRETQAAMRERQLLQDARLDAADGHLTDLHAQLHDVGQVVQHRSRSRSSGDADKPRVSVVFRKGLLTVAEKRLFGWSLRSELVWQGDRYRFSTQDGNDYVYLYMGAVT